MPQIPHSPPVESLDLPALDQGEDGDEVDVGTFELDFNDDAEQPEDALPLDTFEVDIRTLTDSGSNEAASDLDVGGDELLMQTIPDDAGDEAADATKLVGEELDLHLDTPLESDDPSSDAELGDDGLEPLPELVHEAGDGDAGPDVEQTYLPSAPEGAIAKGAPYEVEWLVLGAACSALSTGHGSVLAAGEHLLRFGAEQQSQALPPHARVLSLTAIDDERVVLATTRGLYELAPRGAASALEPPELARPGGSEIVELASARGARHALWARLANGALLRRREGAWERHRTEGSVRALSSHEQRLTLLVLSQRATLQVSADGGSSFREILLPEPAATVAQGHAPSAVSRGAVIVLSDPERGLCVSADGGESFRMVVGAVNVSAAALGEHAGAPAVFAALYREGKDSSEIIVVEPESAVPLSVAELAYEAEEETEESGRTLALVFEAGQLWAAGGYGLARLRPARG